MFRSTIISLLGFFSIVSNASAQTCVGNPVAVQILGSGGPAINPERASAGYLLWVGAQARLLFDIGGGSYIRFGQTRAKLADLAMVGISHLHPDHTSDLAALMWGSNRLRVEPLPIVGPSGNDVAPDFTTFLSRMFDAKSGAYQVLGSTLGAEQVGTERPRLDVRVVDVTKTEGVGSRRNQRDCIAHPARQPAHTCLPRRDAGCLGCVQFGSERYRQEIRGFCKKRQCPDYASRRSRQRSAEPATCLACSRWPSRPRGRGKAADPGPYRSVRSRSRNRRCEESLHWSVNGRQ